jgi:hypothetical protein
VGIFQRADGQPITQLHCFSRHVVPRPHDWPQNAHDLSLKIRAEDGTMEIQIRHAKDHDSHTIVNFIQATLQEIYRG